MPPHPQLSPDLASLFPATAVIAELHGAGDSSTLLSAEAACVERAVPTRRDEFAAGRSCARLALQRLGVEKFALVAGRDRQPLWPDQITGSITHTAGFCAAVVAEKKQLRGLGIDSELHDHIKRHLWPKICVAAEIEWLQSCAESDREAAAALVFCAKEAFYKFQYPLTRERLNFHDVRVLTLQSLGAGGRFAVTPLRKIELFERGDAAPEGRYLRHRNFLTAGVFQ